MKLPDFRSCLVLGSALFAFNAAALGQYVWLDNNGRKQYSDMPPPTSIAPDRILKQPGSKPYTPAAVQPDAGAKPASPALSLAEQDVEFRKRRIEREEKEKKAAEETRVAAENKKRCERLRDYRGALAGGERLVRRAKNGEREFLGDDARAGELRETDRMLAECK